MADKLNNDVFEIVRTTGNAVHTTQHQSFKEAYLVFSKVVLGTNLWERVVIKQSKWPHNGSWIIIMIYQPEGIYG